MSTKKDSVNVDLSRPIWIDNRFMKVLLLSFLILPTTATIDVYALQPQAQPLGWTRVDDTSTGLTIRPMAFADPNENEIAFSGRKGIVFYRRSNESIHGPVPINNDSWTKGAFDMARRHWRLYIVTGEDNASVYIYENVYGSKQYEISKLQIPNITDSAHFEHIEVYYNHPYLHLFIGSSSLGIVKYTYSPPRVSRINTTNGLPSNNIRCLRIRGNTLLAGTDKGFAFFDLETGTNFTYTETDVGEPLVVECIDYYQITNRIYVGTEEGLFVFSENGTHAEPLGPRLTTENGLEYSRVHALEIDTNRKRLYIGTYGGLSFINVDTPDDEIIPMITKEHLEKDGWPEDVLSILIPDIATETPFYLGTDAGYVIEVPPNFSPNDQARILFQKGILYTIGTGLLVSLWIWYTWKSESEQPAQLRKKSLANLLVMGETAHLEFKSSMRWDYNREKSNTDLQEPIAKTIAGFMNSEGGTLLIGVNDEGVVHGLEKDYSTLRKDNSDGFELNLTNVINSRIGAIHRNLIAVDFITYEGKEICKIDVRRSEKPVFLKEGNNEIFVVRQGGRTQTMNAREAHEYINREWPDY